MAIGDLDGDLDLDLAVGKRRLRQRLGAAEQRRRDLRHPTSLTAWATDTRNPWRSVTWTATSTSIWPWQTHTRRRLGTAEQRRRDFRRCTSLTVRATGPASVAIGDLDGDLDLDLAVANQGVSDDVSVLLNNGDGTFAADVTYGVGDEPLSVAIGDLDGDLDLDLAVANASERRRLGAAEQRRRDFRSGRRLRRGQIRHHPWRSVTWTATSTSIWPWQALATEPRCC